MPSRPTPALRKALDYLRARLAVGGPRRLPVIGELAREAGVSHETISRAVRQLALEGLLTVRHRAGIHATGVTPPPLPLSRTPARTARGCKWQRLCGRITADIRSGVIAPVSLLSIKELAARYAVARGTMSRALESLVHAGTLTPSGARYRVAPVRASGAGATIVLVAAAASGGSLAEPTSRTAANLRVLESLCASRGIALRTIAYDWQEGRPLSAARYSSGIAPGGPDAVLGWMVWAAGMATDRTFNIVNELRGHGQPIALLDEWGEPSFASLLDPQGQLGLYELGTSGVCGQRVGTAIAELGHRRVAYISPTGDSTWSRKRRDGVMGAFGDTGIGTHVLSVEREMYLAMSSWHDSDAGLVDALGDAVRDCWHGRRAPTPTVSNALTSLAGKLPETLWNARYREIAEPLFETALSHSDVHAWICDCDLTACHALDFLAGAGVDVPGRISVAGFDNTPIASQRGLTSYDFNGEGTLREMLAHITDPRQRSSRRAIEVPGFVVVRRTVAPPKP